MKASNRPVRDHSGRLFAGPRDRGCCAGCGHHHGGVGGKPEEIGHKVAAALVGTFLGILMCYGLVGPLAANMAKTHEAERAYYQMLRVAMSAFNKGIPPLVAVEVGRRSIRLHIRPSFQEVGKNLPPTRRSGPTRGRLTGAMDAQPNIIKRRWCMAATMAAPGKWLTPIL